MQTVLPKKMQCNSCEGTLFAQAAELYYQSALVSKTGQPTVEVLPVFYCVKCHTVLELDHQHGDEEQSDPADNIIQLNNDQENSEEK